MENDIEKKTKSVVWLIIATFLIGLGIIIAGYMINSAIAFWNDPLLPLPSNGSTEPIDHTGTIVSLLIWLLIAAIPIITGIVLLRRRND